VELPPTARKNLRTATAHEEEKEGSCNVLLGIGGEEWLFEVDKFASPR
jgi:hypothetical protein